MFKDLLLELKGFKYQITLAVLLSKVKNIGEAEYSPVYLCFSSKKVLIKHCEDCLMINGKQNVKLEKGFIGFKNFNRQIPVPFKIYADSGCILKSCDAGLDNDCFSYTRKYQDHIPCSFAYKVACIDDEFSKDVVLCRGKNAFQ